MSVVKNTDVKYSYMETSCRICLEHNSDLVSFSTHIQFDYEDILPTSITDILLKVTNEAVQTQAGFPDLICAPCIILLQSAYIFKIKYEWSSVILNDYFNNSIKAEYNTDVQATSNDNYESEEEKPLVIVKPKPRKKIQRAAKRTHSEANKDIDDEKIVEKKSNVILHPCPICTVELPALELRAHAHTHKALKNYISIPEANQISTKVRFVAKPRKKTESFYSTAEILHKCPYCNQEFTAPALRVHLDQHRKQDEFHCDKCDRVFRKINHLNTHRVRHLKEYPYKCDQCDKGFVIKNNYDCHILTHKNEELPHECSYCLKRFSNPEHLRRHQIIHTETVSYSVKYKVCKCSHCLKTFKDRDELNGHTCMPVQQPTNDQFPCKLCSKVFKRASSLYSHKKFVHESKSAKVLCSVCGLYVSNIYHHMMRHNGEKPYACNQCDKRFTGKPQLRQHLLVHSGVKPYVCSVCAKAFNNLYNLQVHERIHKGNKCHICNVCNKGFLEKSYLKKHMNIHKNL